MIARVLLFVAGVWLLGGCALPQSSYRNPVTGDVRTCAMPPESRVSPAWGLFAILPGGAAITSSVAMERARPYAEEYVQCQNAAKAAGYR